MNFWEPGLSLADVEKEAIISCFKFHRHNKTHTAEELRISVRTLDAKLALYAKDDQYFGDLNKKLDEETAAKLKDLKGDNDDGLSLDELRDQEFSGDSEDAEVSREDGGGAEARLSVEPSEELSKEQSVPVSERSKVQEVLPGSTAKSGADAPEAPRARNRQAERGRGPATSSSR